MNDSLVPRWKVGKLKYDLPSPPLWREQKKTTAQAAEFLELVRLTLAAMFSFRSAPQERPAERASLPNRQKRLGDRYMLLVAAFVKTSFLLLDFARRCCRSAPPGKRGGRALLSHRQDRLVNHHMWVLASFEYLFSGIRMHF